MIAIGSAALSDRMSAPSWQNPIVAPPGQVQSNVDPRQLRPSRLDLSQRRIDLQRTLFRAGTPRLTPILVTGDGVIIDGHHAVRAAAEDGSLIEVHVVSWSENASAQSILDLSVR